MDQERSEGRRTAPADAQWVAMETTNNEEVQSLAEFAVNEQNQKSDGGNLKLGAVVEAWEMSLAPDAGCLYLLHLIAAAPEGPPTGMFQAIVWKTAGGPRLFMSFRMKTIIGCQIL